MSETRTLTVERTTSTGHRLYHYEGACHNVHGHNIGWLAEVTVEMNPNDETNMPVDLKTLSSTIDEVDHALILNDTDPLARLDTEASADPTIALGDVITVPGDPTCEFLAEWMATRLVEVGPAVREVTLTVAETEKYEITTTVTADA